LTSIRGDAIILVPWGRHRERRMFFAVRIIEHVEGHYETQDVEYGRVYKWQPGSITVECEECGQRSTHTKSALIRSLITCECGKDHTARIREELVFQVLEETEDLHPWRNHRHSEGTRIPF
jgi:hypothetical protein